MYTFYNITRAIFRIIKIWFIFKFHILKCCYIFKLCPNHINMQIFVFQMKHRNDTTSGAQWVHDYNPSSLEAEGGGSQIPGKLWQHSENQQLGETVSKFKRGSGVLGMQLSSKFGTGIKPQHEKKKRKLHSKCSITSDLITSL